MQSLFAAALQCALHAHCNAAQLLQNHDAMLQVLDGRLERCPLLWSMAASSCQPDMHAIAYPNGAKFQQGTKLKQNGNAMSPKLVQASVDTDDASQVSKLCANWSASHMAGPVSGWLLPCNCDRNCNACIQDSMRCNAIPEPEKGASSTRQGLVVAGFEPALP